MSQHKDNKQEGEEAKLVPDTVHAQHNVYILKKQLATAKLKETVALGNLYCDHLILKAIQAVQDSSSLFLHSALSGWTFKDSHLYFRGCMYIPPSAHHSLVSSLHESPTMGHAGHFCTKAIIKHNFWWSGLFSFVNAFITGCATCQQNKVNHHLTCSLLSLIPSSTLLPFKQLSVDLITDLSPSSGHDSLLVVVDHSLTKGVILAPCSKNIDAAGITQLFFSHVFKHFDLHDSLISDRGLQFASTFAQELA